MCPDGKFLLERQDFPLRWKPAPEPLEHHVSNRVHMRPPASYEPRYKACSAVQNQLVWVLLVYEEAVCSKGYRMHRYVKEGGKMSRVFRVSLVFVLALSVGPFLAGLHLPFGSLGAKTAFAAGGGSGGSGGSGGGSSSGGTGGSGASGSSGGGSSSSGDTGSSGGAGASGSSGTNGGTSSGDSGGHTDSSINKSQDMQNSQQGGASNMNRPDCAAHPDLCSAPGNTSTPPGGPRNY